MKITVKVHGLLDYAVGVALIALPFLMGWNALLLPAQSLFTIGMFTIAYSLITDYRLGLFKVIPFRIHLLLDVASALSLGILPRFFHFTDVVSLYFLLLALLEIAVVLLTVKAMCPGAGHREGNAND